MSCREVLGSLVDWGVPGPHGMCRHNRGAAPAEPSFVHADVIRADRADDRIYFFFTEVSVEYEFVFKLLVPRVARVCKVRIPSRPGPTAGTVPSPGPHTPPEARLTDHAVPPCAELSVHGPSSSGIWGRLPGS